MANRNKKKKRTSLVNIPQNASTLIATSAVTSLSPARARWRGLSGQLQYACTDYYINVALDTILPPKI